MKKLLPIGSVVLLKNSNKRVMIIGVLQKQSGTDKVWDYSACLFPEGMINEHKLYLFDDEHIERLYFIGLQDAESLAFHKKLQEELEKFETEKTE